MEDVLRRYLYICNVHCAIYGSRIGNRAFRNRRKTKSFYFFSVIAINRMSQYRTIILKSALTVVNVFILHYSMSNEAKNMSNTHIFRCPNVKLVQVRPQDSINKRRRRRNLLHLICFFCRLVRLHLSMVSHKYSQIFQSYPGDNVLSLYLSIIRHFFQLQIRM